MPISNVARVKYLNLLPLFYRVVNPFAAMMGKSKKEEEKEVDYDPTRSSYHPIDHACWKHGDK